METTKTGVWRYGVQCYGVKNRCRKVDFHSERKSLGNPTTASGLPSSQEAIDKAKSWLAANMKSHSKAFATATYWIVEPRTNGFSSELWEPMNEAHNLKFQIVSEPKHGVFALNNADQLRG